MIEDRTRERLIERQQFYSGGGGGGNNWQQTMMLIMLMNQLNNQPKVPQIDQAISERNQQDQSLIRRKLASTQFTGPTGLTELGSTSTPRATNANAGGMSGLIAQSA